VGNLGWLYSNQGRYGEAEPLLRRALAGTEKLLGPEHPDTVTPLLSLAHVYHWAGYTDDAIETLERVVAARERLIGPEHESTREARAELRAWRPD